MQKKGCAVCGSKGANQYGEAYAHKGRIDCCISTAIDNGFGTPGDESEFSTIAYETVDQFEKIKSSKNCMSKDCTSENCDCTNEKCNRPYGPKCML